MGYSDLIGLSDEDWAKASAEHPDSYAGYWPGDDGYLRAGFGQSRDSDHLEASNFAAAKATLEGIDPDGVLDQGASHWAVGWVDTLWIRPTPELKEAVRDLWAALDHYPVLDESDFSNREYEDWCRTVEDAIDCAFYDFKLPDTLLDAADTLDGEERKELGWFVTRAWHSDFFDPDSVPYDGILADVHRVLAGGRTDVDTGEALHVPVPRQCPGQLKLDT